MNDNQSRLVDELSQILGGARLGNSDAETELHRQFVDRLVQLASRKINSRFQSKIAPEEIVQSVFASFFRRHRNGEFQIENWNDLWALLVKITVCKCVNKVNGFLTANETSGANFLVTLGSLRIPRFLGLGASHLLKTRQFLMKRSTIYSINYPSRCRKLSRCDCKECRLLKLASILSAASEPSTDHLIASKKF